MTEWATRGYAQLESIAYDLIMTDFPDWELRLQMINRFLPRPLDSIEMSVLLDHMNKHPPKTIHFEVARITL